MAYQSIDVLQRILADSVFSYSLDRKKAAGRALGTLVELITFYTLRTWGLRDHITIERQVPEFANPGILHNVEFSLHRILETHRLEIESMTLPLTTKKLGKEVQFLEQPGLKAVQFLTTDKVKRNACVIQEGRDNVTVVNLDDYQESSPTFTICTLEPNAFAIFECKRVGVEEGMRKGPQTIEKATQGAYVARTVSSLQKVRLRNGQFLGFIELEDNTFRRGPYPDLRRELIDSPEAGSSGFILTVGVVSNHGNWFTSDNPNKELEVLAQSYDWLLFLSDAGLSQFIESLLLTPGPGQTVIQDTFRASYSGKSGSNRFTKVRIGLDADVVLWDYFSTNSSEVDSWFNVITPSSGNVGELRDDLRNLANHSVRR